MKKTSFPKDRIKILFLENISQTAKITFAEAGFSDIEEIPGALSESELKEKIRDVHILGIRSKTKVSKAVLRNAKKLLAIGCFCIGTNQVDLDAAAEEGIAVFNSPYSNTRSVAELVIGESILLMRKIPEKNAAAHRGIWKKEATASHELRGKTMGIIGYGHIGSQVSILAENLGLKVLFYDTEKKLALGNAQQISSLDSLLESSDIITLHIPLSKQTSNFINRKNIEKIKEGAVILNLSRGNVIDLKALKSAIENKRIKGAAIDVYPIEPEKNGDRFDCILAGMENVILTPHIGGSTLEAQENIGREVATKIIDFIDKGISTGSFSIPEISLPPQKNTSRILHIHKNVPGMLSEINSVVAKAGSNISAQYLNTKNEIGYVVLDIDKGSGKKVLKALNDIKNTIKTRILY
ncbi:MAG: phosphoglycerate dehydrogenase [Chitinophagaceae bacterium]|nr:MAG: phosphoglycerate dehydrogenase [Chitinophagaceae bacterium]